MSHALVSGVNFGVVVVAARQLPAAGLGQYMIAFSSATFLVGLNRAANIEGVLLRQPLRGRVLPDSLQAESIQRSAKFGASLALSASAAALIFCSDPEVQVLVIIAGWMVLFWCVTDVSRIHGIAAANHRSVIYQDSSLLGVTAAASVIFILSDSDSAAGALSTIAIPVAFVGLVNLVKARSLLRPKFSEDGSRDRRSFAGEYLVSQGGSQLASFIVVATVGIAQVGAWRATQSLFGPLNILFTATNLTASTELLRRVDERSCFTATQLWVRAATPILVVGALSVGVVLAGILTAGPTLLGENWLHAADLVAPMALQYLGMCTLNIGLLALRASRRTGTSFILRILSTGVTLIAVSSGVFSGDIVVVSWAMALSTQIVAAAYILLGWTSLQKLPKATSWKVGAEGEKG